ncbi:asparagine synthase (glutamine-hydrolyzing) [uncultured Winogradskyella sp.]|uniref:asparagine synthase (glutamine-hydrolyzing) n=1 Tax=uncultured Winogradskyella sp. TaxID=395353 RepID=UPI00262EFF1C|nr:asparagine synthase (glutamine-hydrolyzing) [uncultured Winogradskyella sp.]
MCGFTGFINLNQQPLKSHVLKQMTDIQVHRGPDDQGMVGFSLFKDPKVNVIDNETTEFSHLHAGIGFNRLSILDLSKRGHQPMLSACGNYILAYNGETYNALSFRDELINKGHPIQSRTDSEVILYLYIEYGIKKTLELLNGMFAFIIVDLKLRKSFIVRDQLGIKPMYIYNTPSVLMFSSEIKSFTKHPEFKAELNTDHIDEYLLFRYCAHDRTLYKDVKQVPPGHYYEISKDHIEVKEYWSYKLGQDKNINEKDAIELLDATFKDSIKSQLMSDVLVGCQLSGGIDSSIVTTYAREFFNANMDTFSIVFSDEKYSEEEFINYVTNHTNSDSHRYQYSNQYAYENFFKATWHLDQPISIPNTLGIKRLAERAKENVTVLLSGEGADELFGGYSRYHDLSCRFNMNLKGYAKVPIIGTKIQGKYNLEQTPEDFFIMSSSAMSIKDFSKFSLNNTLESVLAQRKELFPNEGDLIKRASVYDLKTYMVDLLNRQDKMTMAHSVENRVPFLDKNMVELVMTLPSELLVKNCNDLRHINKSNNYTKYILKELAVKRFSKDFVYRKKSGFPLPVKDLFLKTGMHELIEDQLLPGLKSRGIFNYDEVSKIWNKKNNGFSKSDIKNLWMFFAFETWVQTFVDGTYNG